MKKIYTLLIILFLLTQSTSAQLKWEWQNPDPLSASIIEMSFVNSTTGWALVYRGWIIKTTDSGVNWTVIYKLNYHQIDPQADYWDIFFLDELQGIITTGQIIFTTRDGGNTWMRDSLGVENEIQAVWITSTDTAYIAGTDIILKTTNSGDSWFPVDTSSRPNKSLYFFNSLEGFSAGWHGIYKTTDGGNSWYQTSGLGCSDITFADDSTGYVAFASGGIAKSTDRGENWFPVNPELHSTYYDISFSDRNNGIAGGEHCRVIRTSDGGLTWELQLGSDEGDCVVRCVKMIDSLNALAASYFIVRTSDGGKEWISQHRGVTSTITGISFFDEMNGLAAAAHGIILRTTDGGANWITVYTGTDLFLDELQTVGSSFAAAAGNHYFMKSLDGGLTWLLKYFPIGDFKTLCFIDENKGFLGGNGGTFLRTTNGGDNWTPLPAPSDYSIDKIIFYDDLFGIALLNKAFAGSLIYITNDGGLNWSTIASPTNRNLNGTSLLNYETWIVAGSKVYRTTDAGNSWDSTSFFSSLGEMHFFDDHTGIGFGAGISSGVFLTTDGGTTWYLDDVITSAVNDIAVTGKRIYAAGYAGAILSSLHGFSPTELGETVSTSSADYSLGQNYPNPFNPSTKIIYSLPAYSGVTIKVFDILGNEVVTLVDEEKSAGTYEVTWNAANLPSGVYFYQLRAGDFIQVKKIILMK